MIVGANPRGRPELGSECALTYGMDGESTNGLAKIHTLRFENPQR